MARQLSEQIESGVVIFKENKKTGLQCGINAYGELFVGDKESGANMPYTPQNKERILAEFERWNYENEHEWDVFFDDRF